MALGLTEEHLQLAETVRGWAERHCPPETVRAAADGPDGGSALYLESLAPGLAGQGLLGLHLPEEDGGQGFGLPELTVALEELGRALVPGSFLPTVFASAVLVAAGVSGKLVTGLADGSKAGAVSLAPGLTGTADAAGDGTAGGGLVVERRVRPGARRVPGRPGHRPGADRRRRGVGRRRRQQPRDHRSGQPGPHPAGGPGPRRPGRRARGPDPDRAGPALGHQPGRDPVRGRGVRHRRLGHARRRRLRQDPPPVRPADRPVPGGQAPVRMDADRGRAGRRRRLGRRPHRRRRRRRPGRAGPPA